ncbi:SDR family NAD(P)-dependent oxidoreductase [Yinghuangia seranimata]|uniref:SDR family NAD(P)-dependent oxidoreductase n=1 Tax=Yinghuangia seranimata TaxID=408067 RepID=UPI00248C045F|nr:SDR family NAD(P)-dependent oxidoreductase [Yinghuangia seranimata]MDI2127662.1 SDR family NAD(P)-dependent oxidoreductase [Yinghuangia seranimata]
MDATTAGTAVVIGATSGIGRETARQLAAHGHDVVAVGRDAANGAALLRDLAADAAHAGRVDPDRHLFVPADVSTAAGVADVARRVHDRTDAVAVLVNGAGLVSRKRRTTAEGRELNFAVHHLAPYSTTSALLPLLRAGGGRVVNINSEGHRAPLSGTGTVAIDFDDLDHTRDYNPYMAYSRTKLANLLFTHELHRRHPELTVTALHPGMVRTGIGRDLPRVQVAFLSLMALPVRQGAQPVVRLAVADDVVPGAYYDRFTRVTPSAASRDRATAARLWDVTAALRGPFGR